MYYPDLYGLLLKAFGPATVIAPALVEIAGVERASLFGSWAARYLGTPGEDPHDIDLMVVGDPSRAKVARAARSLTERLGREVNVTIVSPERWEDAADGFIRQVRGGPLVELALGTVFAQT